MTELKSSLLDFEAQIGQTQKKYVQRVQPVGGDGLSFQRVLELKSYLRFHEHEFGSFGLLKPFLEALHTLWTNLCDIH
jgi:hypothetical protein